MSKATVSHVLSGNRPVAAATRLKVERAVRELEPEQGREFLADLAGRRVEGIVIGRAS